MPARIGGCTAGCEGVLGDRRGASARSTGSASAAGWSMRIVSNIESKMIWGVSRFHNVMLRKLDSTQNRDMIAAFCAVFGIFYNIKQKN